MNIQLKKNKNLFKTRKKKRANYFISFILLIFSLFFIFELIILNINTLNVSSNLIDYLYLLFKEIGLFGIIALFSYFFNYNNKRLYYLLIVWSISIIMISSTLFYLEFIFNTNLSDKEYWFQRIIYYSTIPLSILAAFNIDKVITKIKSLRSINKYWKEFAVFNLISVIIFFSISNISLTGFYWYNREDMYHGYFSDDEAQILGWCSENIPYDSNYLIDDCILSSSTVFPKALEDLTFSKTFYLNDEIENAIENNSEWRFDYTFDLYCSLKYFENIDDQSKVLRFNDQNDNGYVILSSEFDSQNNGTIEFSLLSNNTSQRYLIHILSDDLYISIIEIKSDSVYLTSAMGQNEIVSISRNQWTNFRIDFESSEDNYAGLNQYEFQIYIDNISYGKYNYIDYVSEVRNVKFLTTIDSKDYSILITNVSFSWNNDFEFEETVISWKTELLINYLILKKINLFIYCIDTNKNKDINLLNYYNDTLYKVGRFEVRSL